MPFYSDEKIVYFAEVYQWRCIEESGLWLKNVDRTHLVLNSGKLVLQKNYNDATLMENLIEKSGL